MVIIALLVHETPPDWELWQRQMKHVWASPAPIHLLICFSYLHEIQSQIKRKSCWSQKLALKKPLFCCLMGLKSTFSLAGLQTAITRFNKSELSYINTVSVEQRWRAKKERWKEEKGERSTPRTRCNSKKCLRWETEPESSVFNQSRRRTQSFHSVTRNVLTESEDRA